MAERTRKEFRAVRTVRSITCTLVRTRRSRAAIPNTNLAQMILCRAELEVLSTSQVRSISLAQRTLHQARVLNTGRAHNTSLQQRTPSWSPPPPTQHTALTHLQPTQLVLRHARQNHWRPTNVTVFPLRLGSSALPR